AHAITTDAWRNSLDHYQEFVIIVALDLKIEELRYSSSSFRLSFLLCQPSSVTTRHKHHSRY
ncbi:hypothetical protein EFP44_09830, partial [Lacticaseibacillus paracasei]|nr:hypothetical protein [Lacticaseibacillus paracasei]